MPLTASKSRSFPLENRSGLNTLIGRQLGRRLKDALMSLALLSVASMIFASSAFASPALLTPGHAYCYYFSTSGHSGGMHLVAAGPTVIAAGPSNYVSGMNRKPQDTVFYIDCASGPGRVGGDEYLGLPRIAAHLTNGRYAFHLDYTARNLKHIGTNARATSTAEVVLSGSVVAGAISGTIHLSAPGCVPRPFSMPFTGT